MLLYLRYYECCPYPYPDISYFFAIKRNPSYYLFTLIVPSAFINIVTVIGFFTPYSSTGENSEKVRKYVCFFIRFIKAHYGGTMYASMRAACMRLPPVLLS